jgi:hypothetical protein
VFLAKLKEIFERFSIYLKNKIHRKTVILFEIISFSSGQGNFRSEDIKK